MPLIAGKSPEVIQFNIREMRNAGHPENVAVAAAYANARKHGDGEKHARTAKRPGLHADHPFNNAKAPANRRKVGAL